jgi:hypothetical protein
MNDTVDIPREKLGELIAKHGDVLWQDRDRCEGLLRDHCGSYRREISALSAALHERVPQELRGSWQSAMTPEAMRARLIQRLEDNRGLAPQVAGWAVDAWSHALKVPLGRISDRLNSEVIVPGGERAVSTGDNTGSVWMSGASQTSNNSVTPRNPEFVASSREIPVVVEAGKVAPSGAMALVSSPKVRSFGGLGLVAAAVLAYMLIVHRPDPTPIPCPNRAADGSCTSGDVTPPAPKPVVTKPVPAPVPPPPVAPVVDVVNSGTPFRVRVNENLSSESATVGQFVSGVLMDPVSANGKQISAPGAKAILVVQQVSQAGAVGGTPTLGLAVYQIYVHDRPMRVSTNQHLTKGPSRTVETAKKTGVMAAAGCVAGGLVGKIFHKGGKGCLAGTAAGGGGGVLLSANSAQKPAVVPAETVLNFRLVQPLSVPVNAAATQAAAGSKS